MKVVFLSPMCVLDTRSGAALEMRTLLGWLSEAGHEAYSISATLFDGRHEFPMTAAVGAEGAAAHNQGKMLRFWRDGVRHHVLYTKSTQGRHLERDEAQRLLTKTDEILRELQPDVVIGYGSDTLSKKLWESARRHTRTLVFYLANASYQYPDVFQTFDHVLCPSPYLRDLYRERLGINPGVLRTMIHENNRAPAHEVTSVASIGSRSSGFITFINPTGDKGATLVMKLVEMAWAKRPDFTFLLVEGRVSADAWREIKPDFVTMPNIWWIPNQQDMRRVYKRTAALLFPSFIQEAAGRAITEAQLGGIPVLGANRGGIPDQLNGGGFCFDLPDALLEKYTNVPNAHIVQPWFDTLQRLMDDDAYYMQAVQRAHRAAEPFEPAQRKKDAVAEMLALADQREAAGAAS
ncbi:hypothetical protein SAMN05216241_1067 [Limimonas halophila]|uniref:Uncharacterized protein n=1 Tax=Limimonas halophila TaxID=1082479 RepID=A0A1G7RV25_9PROT|nr:hypothetical protein [Limimonas halophila]SDG14601.1 hypothetical protein SAMN05216241_1067 [Limimonas halophila]